MKKLTLFISLLCCLQICNAQRWTKHDIDSAYKANLDTTGLTVKQVYTDAKEGFTKLVTTLQGPAKHVYEIYVKQYLINGISKFLISLLFVIITLTLINRSLKHLNFDRDDKDTHVTGFIIGCILAVITLIIIINFLSNGVSMLINPEYYAIQDIIETIK